MLLKYYLIFTLVACFDVRALTQVSDGYKCSGKVKITQTGQSIISSVGNYSANSRCSWLIVADSPHSLIRLQIEHFETESDYDSLYIYRGNSVNSYLFATLSGHQSDRKVIELEADDELLEPNTVLLYFSSDSHVNLAGFNITFYQCIDRRRLGENPSGIVCDEKRTLSCPNNCFNELGYGECSVDYYGIHRCRCSNGHVGDDCGQKVSEGIWQVTSTPEHNEAILRTSAGHCAYVWEHEQYTIGGMSYRQQGYNELIKLDEIYGQTLYPMSSAIPSLSFISPRYGHSCILVGHKAYLYGGTFMNSTDTNDLWMYDMSSLVHHKIRYDYSTEDWRRVEPSTQCGEGEMCAPIKVSGHTANLIKGPNGEDKMLVIFGYSSKYGYLSTVQEFDLETNTWQIVNTTGFPVRGSYGHTSVYDESSNIVYVYGGLVDAIEPTNRLYAYHTLRKEWNLAAPSPSDARYLHSAVLVSKNMMLVFGGKTSNMYKKPDTIVYDLTCDSWQKYQMPEGIDTSRYGHSAVMYNESMYIYSGFDGELIYNMLIFTPGTCEQYENSTQCLGSQVGLKCLWIEDTKSCKALKDVDNYTKYPNCLEPTEQLTLRMKSCQELTDCESCTQTTNDCVWCDGECSHHKNCTNKAANVTRSPEMCGKALSKESQVKFIVPHENCAEIRSCGDCLDTADACFWCQNQQRCFERHGYEAVFPYGQCRDYNMLKEQCPDANAAPGDWCSSYKNCTDCGNDPACGWCDDLSGTGTGKCLHGGADGPKSCPSRHQWYYTETCPKCQCNGHSTCHPETGDCIEPCNDLTEGPHCDRCQPGYWGNPVNGEKCKVCDCGSQNYCDDKTGKCSGCETIGVTGDLCEKCDASKNYVEGPLPGACYYNLEPNYQYTFNLTNDGFEGLRKINFKNSVLNETVPAFVDIQCSVNARVDVRIEDETGSPQFVLKHFPCSESKSRKMFVIDDYTNSIDTEYIGEKNTVYVHLYEFQKPAIITISFTQNLYKDNNK